MLIHRNTYVNNEMNFSILKTPILKILTCNMFVTPALAPGANEILALSMLSRRWSLGVGWPLDQRGHVTESLIRDVFR